MLNGKSVLVLEEEFLIALDIQRILETIGAGQTLFARTLDEARAVVSKGVDIGLAVIEVRTADSPALELAKTLFDSNVAIVFSTADISLSGGLAEVPDAPVLAKPMAEADLIAAISMALLDEARKNGYAS